MTGSSPFIRGVPAEGGGPGGVDPVGPGAITLVGVADRGVRGAEEGGWSCMATAGGSAAMGSAAMGSDWEKGGN